MEYTFYELISYSYDLDFEELYETVKKDVEEWYGEISPGLIELCFSDNIYEYLTDLYGLNVNPEENENTINCIVKDFNEFIKTKEL